MRRASLVVLSHLRWNFVFQRPQHLMTRFAADRQVLFIEEPVHDPSGSRWEIVETASGVTVCTPYTTSTAQGFDDEQLVALEPMVRELIAKRVQGPYDLWFYAPLAAPLADTLRPRTIVFDNMDDLASFKFAPPKLKERELELLRRADVVFTGGPSLYDAMKGRHPNVHCFSSSVDAAHFGKATRALSEPEGQRGLPRPRLGYFGVLDERFDIPLLDAAASMRPDWQFVMVGPVAKIDPSDLPRRANIHYVGQQSYERLPEYLSGWDVALLPFARNDSTRRISPTKILEYMAADKPIVSTRIADVVGPYASMVGLGDEPAEFVAACERALHESEVDRFARLELFDEVLSKTSWDATVRAMAERMDQAAEATTRRRGDGSPAVADSNGETAAREPASLPIVVIGAGPTGLSAAYHIGEDATLIEANDQVGGWCRSLVDNGFTFDWAGHIMFSNDPYVHEMYRMLLGDNVHWQDREAWIYSKGVHTRYPFQGSLYGLPADVIQECIVGAIESRFGSLDAKKPQTPTASTAAASNGHESAKPVAVRAATFASDRLGNGHASHDARAANGRPATNGRSSPSDDARTSFVVRDDLSKRATTVAHDCRMSDAIDPKDAELTDCCADGIAESEVPLVSKNGHASSTTPSSEPANFEEFIYKVWGAGIAKHFAIPYNRKIWAVPLDEMETSWLGGRVPLPDLEEMIAGALSPKPRPMGPNARFGYPLRGGFQTLMEGFLPHLRGDLRLRTRIVRVSPSRKALTLSDGEEVVYDQLVSTMPLPALVRAMGEEAPAEIRRAASSLRYTSVRCVNLGVGRENLTEKHWIYYPEETVFHRIFVQGNASPHCNPPGGFGLTCEITYGPLKPLPCDGDDLIRRCVEDCISVGLFRGDDEILAANQVDMPYAYVVYDHARKKNVAMIRDWLETRDIHLAGRYSEWEYYNSDHAFLAGKKVAEAALRRIRERATVI